MPLNTRIIILILFIMSGCAPARYKAIYNQESLLSNEARSVRPIVINDTYLERADRFNLLINSKKWTDLDKEIQSIGEIKVKNFIRAARLIADKQYYVAYHTLTALQESDFDCQVKILKTDCLYELKVDSVDFKRKYQEALDCSNNPLVKKIAIDRHRFIKYEM